MSRRATIVAILLGAVSPVLCAQTVAELRWDRKLEHFTRAEASAYDAWIIAPPARGSENPLDLGTVLDAISHEANSSIAHIFLGELVRRPELQKAVIEDVTAQPEFQKHPPPTGFGRWEFKNSTKMRALIGQALLRSPFVTDCNTLLAKHGKAVKSVSMEKLFFMRKDGQWGWDAIVWLMIDPPPKDSAKAGGK